MQGNSPHHGVYRLGDHVPSIHESVWIAPTAAVIGQVEIGPESGIWFGTVLRGDANTIKIGARTNIQDATVVHVDPGEHFTVIGDDVTIGHACIIHGCRLGNRVIVGMGATILSGGVIEDDGMLAAGALLTPGNRIRAGELWSGVPAKFRRLLREEERAALAANTQDYVVNARRYRAGLEPVHRLASLPDRDFRPKGL